MLYLCTVPGDVDVSVRGDDHDREAGHEDSQVGSCLDNPSST